METAEPHARAQRIEIEVAVVREYMRAAAELALERLAVLHRRRASRRAPDMAEDDRGGERVVLDEMQARAAGRGLRLLHEPHVFVHVIGDAPAVLVPSREPAAPRKSLEREMHIRRE